MHSSFDQRSLRRQLTLELGSYNDKNDGFLRSLFSRNKNRRSRCYKAGKVRRVKAPWKE
jgi:hypothetical protein